MALRVAERRWSLTRHQFCREWTKIANGVFTGAAWLTGLRISLSRETLKELTADITKPSAKPPEQRQQEQAVADFAHEMPPERQSRRNRDRHASVL